MRYYNIEVPEANVLDVLSNMLYDENWEIVDRIERVAFPKIFTQPEVQSVILRSENQTYTFNIPKYAKESYLLLNDRTPHVSIDKEIENKDGSLSITVSGLSNGVNDELGTFVEITAWYSPLHKNPDYMLVVGYADHLIVKNKSGNYYGIAKYGFVKKKLRYFDFFPNNLPFFVPVIYGRPMWGTDLEPNSYEAFYSLMELIKGRYMENNSLYIYQLMNYMKPDPYMAAHIIGIDSNNPDEIKRAALDMEVYTTAWDEVDALGFKHRITQKYDEENYQGPIVRANYRRDDLEEWMQIEDFDYKVTNWWNDSKINVSGVVDEQTVALVIQSDTAPVKGQDAAVPAIPVYFGDFTPITASSTLEDSFSRSYIFNFAPGGDIHYIPIATPYPVQDASMEIWVSGDLPQNNNPLYDFNSESWLRITVGNHRYWINNAYQIPVVNDKESAIYKGVYPLYSTIGKDRFTIVLETSNYVRTGNPALRVWIKLTVKSGLSLGAMNSCVFAGYVPPSPGFDFDNSSRSRFVKHIFPLLKQGKNIEAYPQFPSNGADTVQVKLTKYGARYQEYYIAWNTPSNLIPPPREGEKSKAKHPRAWNNFNSSVYRYQYNPSHYDDYTHVSRAYLVHPEDGVHGYLRNVVLLNPLSILTGDEIELEIDGCTEPYIYECHVIEGISPLTKRPGTPYRPALLALKKGESQ